MLRDLEDCLALPLPSRCWSLPGHPHGFPLSACLVAQGLEIPAWEEAILVPGQEAQEQDL